MFRPSLTEKMKLEIARLYNTTDLPVEAIATQLKVSARSVHRFKDYKSSIENNSQNQPQETYSETKHYSENKIVFIGGKKHKGKNNKKSGNENKNNALTKEEFQWKCPECSHEWNGYMLECPNCGVKLQE